MTLDMDDSLSQCHFDNLVLPDADFTTQGPRDSYASVALELAVLAHAKLNTAMYGENHQLFIAIHGVALFGSKPAEATK